MFFDRQFASYMSSHMRGYPQWRWHLDEVFAQVHEKLCYLWRAVDHEGAFLEAGATARQSRGAEATQADHEEIRDPSLHRHRRASGSSSAAMNEIGFAAERHEVGGRLNNRAE